MDAVKKLPGTLINPTHGRGTFTLWDAAHRALITVGNADLSALSPAWREEIEDAMRVLNIALKHTPNDSTEPTS